MDHEIASSRASTTGDAHSATTIGEDTRKVVPANEDSKSVVSERKYILPPSRARPACCKHAAWCKIRSNRNDRNCCEHSNLCHNHQGCSRPIPRNNPHKIVKTVKNSDHHPRQPYQKKKRCISKKNREKKETFHAKKWLTMPHFRSPTASCKRN